MAALEVRSSESESEVEEVEGTWPCRGPRLGVKRRRVLDSRNISTVPIYSGRVNRTLQLYQENSAEVDKHLWNQVNLSDSDEDLENERLSWKSSRVSPQEQGGTVHSSDSDLELENRHRLSLSPRGGSPSPPSSPSLPNHRNSRAVTAIREVNQKLGELNDFRSCPLGVRLGWESEDLVWVGTQNPPRVPPSPRVMTLKLQCRGLVHRVPLKETDPLQKAVDELASRLQVDASRLVLLHHELELPLGETPESRNLTVADILDCFVLSDAPRHGECDRPDSIRLQVRALEKDSLQSITIGKNDTLLTLMEMYKVRTGLQHRCVCFQFDGRPLSECSTPQELDLEPDDIIDACVHPHGVCPSPPSLLV